MKKIVIFMFLSVIILFSSGCIKRDSMEDITIYTTSYPITYITNYLYADHANINSIYPSGVVPSKYTLTDKQIIDYSNCSLFIFNGLSNEDSYVAPMFNHNKKLMIINSTQSMEYLYGEEELWLDPSNFLMMANNIKNGLNEYINNHYLKADIEEKYEKLRVEISNLDAKMQLIASKANNNKIIVSSDLFNYLDKYGLEIYSLEENSNLTDKKINEILTLINNGEVSYIFAKQNEELNETIKNIQSQTNIQILTLHTLSNLTNNEESSKKDYISIMNENIEQLKLELYN